MPARDLRQGDLVKVDCGPRQNVALPPPELPLGAMAASARLDARLQGFAQIGVLYWLLSPCCEFPVSSRLIQPNKKGLPQPGAAVAPPGYNEDPGSFSQP